MGPLRSRAQALSIRMPCCLDSRESSGRTSGFKRRQASTGSPGGRAKDLDDAAAILCAQRGTLDLHRVRETLRQIEQALDRSDLVAALERIVALAGAG